MFHLTGLEDSGRTGKPLAPGACFLDYCRCWWMLVSFLKFPRVTKQKWRLFPLDPRVFGFLGSIICTKCSLMAFLSLTSEYALNLFFFPFSETSVILHQAVLLPPLVILPPKDSINPYMCVNVCVHVCTCASWHDYCLHKTDVKYITRILRCQWHWDICLIFQESNLELLRTTLLQE